MIAKVADRERRYQQTREIHLSKRELSGMYALYEPHKAACKESQSLKGFARLKYDKEHKDSLEKHPEMRGEDCPKTQMVQNFLPLVIGK